MSYADLVRIANNDALAEGMSEEEYEALSVELWRKFALEHRIAASSEATAISPAFPAQSLTSAVRNFLRTGFGGRTPTAKSAAPANSPHQPSLSRSGD